MVPSVSSIAPTKVKAVTMRQNRRLRGLIPSASASRISEMESGYSVRSTGREKLMIRFSPRLANASVTVEKRMAQPRYERERGNSAAKDSAQLTISPTAVFRQARKTVSARKAAPKRPKVFLANMGPVRQHKARADFSTGFFDVGGFEILSNAGFKDVPAAAEAALASGAEIVVVCSTDDTYPEIVPDLTRAIKAAKPETVVVLAGYPADFVEAFKAAGVDEFIHVKANCRAVNEALLKRVGVAL